MSDTTYTAGPATGIAAQGAIAVVSAPPAAPTVRLIRAALQDRRPMADVLMAVAGLGLAELPPFVIAAVEAGGVRIAYRGELAVHVHRGHHTDTLLATGVSTWREELLVDVDSISVGLAVATAGEHPYAVADGTFPVGSLRWQAAATPAKGSAVAAATMPDAVPAVAEEQAAESPAAPDSPADDEMTAPGVVEAAAPAPAAAHAHDGLESGPEPATESSAPEPAAAPVPPVAPAPAAPVNAAPPAAAPAAAAPGGQAMSVDDIDFSHLVEHTVYRQVEDAAIRHTGAAEVPAELPTLVNDILDPDATIHGGDTPAAAASSSAPTPPPAPGPPSDAPVAGDHDGNTVMRRAATGPRATPPPPGPVGGARVLAVRCPQGHPNPPQTPTCRVCGQLIANRGTENIPRPTLGVLRFSTGLVVPVNGPLAIGRRPPTDQYLGQELATAIAIEDSELSRFHAAVFVTDWYVHVEDQGSTNGTMVVIPGHPDQVLRPRERAQVTYGSVINLGGAVTATFDVM